MSNLFAIHIPGPDEYHTAPSEAAAYYMAKRHNDAMAAYFAKHPDPEGFGPPVESTQATVVPWPFEAEDHAEDLKSFDYEAWGLEKQEGGS